MKRKIAEAAGWICLRCIGRRRKRRPRRRGSLISHFVTASPQGKPETGERPAGAQAPSVSFADSSLPEGAKYGDANGDEEAAYGLILPAPRLAGFSERVNDGAIEVIARMVADSDSAGDQQEARWSFRERVRGVLALVHELRGGYGK